MRKKARELFASCRPIIVALCLYHEQIVNFLHLKHLVPVKLAEADAPGADLGKPNALQQHCFVLIALVSWNQVSSEMESLTSLSLYFTPSVMSSLDVGGTCGICMEHATACCTNMCDLASVSSRTPLRLFVAAERHTDREVEYKYLIR